MGSDARIGPHFLFPGPGFGGSCFPKDVRALLSTGSENGVPLDVISAVQAVNQRQKQLVFEKLSGLLENDIENRRVAVWGLAFKAQTDDMRESPAIDLIQKLVDNGAEVQAHDPEAINNAKQLFGDRIEYHKRAYDALVDVDALAIVTEWLAFRTPDFDRMKELMKQPIIVDARNLYEPSRMKQRGFTYVGIGRGAAL
jgi:UDPglucose 6-dehydrogenase